MLLPSKYENLNSNLLVVGAAIIRLLKQKSYNVETLYRDVIKTRTLSLENYFYALTFLWMSDIVVLVNQQVVLGEKNVFKTDSDIPG